MDKSNSQSNVPVTAGPKAHGIFERYGAPIVEGNRWFTFGVLLLIVVLVQGIAIFRMLPLHKPVPYKVEVSESGQVAVRPVAATEYKPGDKEKKYFLTQWTTKLLTLDRFFSEKYLLDAYSLTRDQASEQFSDYVARFQPLVELKKDPSLNQQVTIRSVSFVQDGVALVRVRLDKRATNQSTSSKDMLLTINFALVEPETDEDIYRNPIGLFITQFALSEDIM